MRQEVRGGDGIDDHSMFSVKNKTQSKAQLQQLFLVCLSDKVITFSHHVMLLCCFLRYNYVCDSLQAISNPLWK